MATGNLNLHSTKIVTASPERRCKRKTYWELRPRRISTGQLNPSQGLHPRPINPVVYGTPYLIDSVSDLILGPASRLDAFSGYPIRTWLPGLCPWRDNRYTSGSSTPVLSY